MQLRSTRADRRDLRRSKALAKEETAIAYRISPGSPIAEEVRRIADEQIARALESLGQASSDVEEAVHDARKRCKKLRALLRLVRPGLAKTYADENRFFRDLARGLSDVRDAQVLNQTITGLVSGDEKRAARELLEPVAAWSRHRRARALESRDLSSQIERTSEALQAARRRLAEWKLSEPAVAHVSGGLAKTYKRARNRHRDALAKPEPERLHEWRKRVKYHWYHCRLLKEAWPEGLKPRTDALDRLADLLGDDHDLAVLAAELGDAEEEFPEASLRFARELIMRRSRNLRDKAFSDAPKLFVETPDALARRFEGYWTLATAQVAE